MSALGDAYTDGGESVFTDASGDGTPSDVLV